MNNGSKKDKDGDNGPVQGGNNPRKVFSAALDAVWTDLAASDISKGALVSPPEDGDPLEEINWSIKSSKKYLGLLKATLSVPNFLSRPLNSKPKSAPKRDTGVEMASKYDNYKGKKDKSNDTSNPMNQVVTAGGRGIVRDGSQDSLSAMEADSRSAAGSTTDNRSDGIRNTSYPDLL
jgi:hypothetical protein